MQPLTTDDYLLTTALVIIPARGGSKGVPGKNIKPLAGKPLIQYTIEAARSVFPDERICISTDSTEIKDCVESLGLEVPFLRPAELATDQAGTRAVLLHALDFYEQQGYSADRVVLLQPTSPFRTGKHLQEALTLFDPEIEMVVSVKETKANPYYVLFEENESGWLEKSKEGHFKTRQECPKVWEYNGAIYIIDAATFRKNELSDFRKIRKYVMDEESSHDIDTALDWMVAERLVEWRNTGSLTSRES